MSSVKGKDFFRFPMRGATPKPAYIGAVGNCHVVDCTDCTDYKELSEVLGAIGERVTLVTADSSLWSGRGAAAALVRKANQIVLLPGCQAIRAKAWSSLLPARSAKNMEEVVKLCLQGQRSGRAVVFAPAAGLTPEERNSLRDTFLAELLIYETELTTV